MPDWENSPSNQMLAKQIEHLPAVIGSQLLDVHNDMLDSMQGCLSAKFQRCFTQSLDTVVLSDVLQTGWDVERYFRISSCFCLGVVVSNANRSHSGKVTGFRFDQF